MISETLRALLIYAKKEDSDFNWESIAGAIEYLYGCKLRFVDVMRIVTRAYKEALLEPRFELNHQLDDLLLSPVVGTSAIELFTELGSTYSVEQFYNSILNFVMCKLMMTRVDWIEL